MLLNVLNCSGLYRYIISPKGPSCEELPRRIARNIRFDASNVSGMNGQTKKWLSTPEEPVSFYNWCSGFPQGAKKQVDIFFSFPSQSVLPNSWIHAHTQVVIDFDDSNHCWQDQTVVNSYFVCERSCGPVPGVSQSVRSQSDMFIYRYVLIWSNKHSTFKASLRESTIDFPKAGTIAKWLYKWSDIRVYM